MKIAFLFGAGAEIGYGFPSGDKFALDMFRFDASSSKKRFKDMRDQVDLTTDYASRWLPDDFRDKNISSFGKTVFQNIIKDTMTHNRDSIIKRINQFDDIARKEAKLMADMEERVDIDLMFRELLNREVANIRMTQSIKFIDEFRQGNDLFNSSYYSALLMVYKKKDLLTREQRTELRKVLLSILQLYIGALGESLTQKINDGLFVKKDEDFDFFDDIGEIIQLDYSSSGLTGLEYLLDKYDTDTSSNGGKCILFARRIMESIYATALDYKSLIDANWHYLYSPASDWAKFCKICIFLLTAREYIVQIAEQVTPETKYGYYHSLKEAMDKGLFKVVAVATTNYNRFIEKILHRKVSFLNGSTETWYDPYLNRIEEFDEKSNSMMETTEKHILVPLMFTQSGTKPMTSIEMLNIYVDMYKKWKKADKIVVVGFGFGPDDEHINGIIRTLIDLDDKVIDIVTIESGETDDNLVTDYAKKLKVAKSKNISVIQVNETGKTSAGKMWTELISTKRG